MTTVKRELKTKLHADLKTIDAAILAIQKAGKKLDGMIQVAGMSILKHIDDHGDISRFNALWAAMPQGARKNALAEWAFKYGKLSANKAENKAEVPFLFDREKKTDLLGAEDTPWFMFKPEKPVDEEFDFQKLMQMLMQKAQKAEEAGTPIKGAAALKAVREALYSADVVNGTAVEA